MGERARGGGGAARGEERCGRAPARLRGPKRHGAPSAQPDEHLQRLPAAGAGQRRRSGGRIRAAAHGQGARGSGHPGPAGRGRDGSAVSGGRRRSPGGPAERAAVARNVGRLGASRRQDHRHRDPLRRPAPARRDPLMRVTVLTGGATAERAVAFASAAQMVAALRSRGHDVHVVDTTRGPLSAADETQLLSGTIGTEVPDTAALEEAERRLLADGLAELPVVQRADVLCLALHGGTGEGGTLQAILDVVGVPYTGSGALGSALAMDKDLSKRLFRAAGVPVPAWFMTPVAPEDVTTALGWPVIVKPSKQGSTVGLTLVKNAKGLDAAVALAAGYDDEVMVEQFIPGRELTVGVLGDVPLPVGEIVPKHELFDYETKYTPGMSEETFPARIETLLARQLQEYAVMAHRALKLNGYSRVDFRVTPEGDIFCLEANSLPGMTRTSLYPQAAQAAGIPFPELCERVARLARNKRTGRGA